MIRDMIAMKHQACGGTAWWQTPESIDNAYLATSDIERIDGSHPTAFDPVKCETCGKTFKNGPKIGLHVKAYRKIKAPR